MYVMFEKATLTHLLLKKDVRVQMVWRSLQMHGKSCNSYRNFKVAIKCIHALRRFIAWRGTIQHIRCDNGTNVVGAERELKQALTEMNQEQVRELLMK
jgi:hypothetical protein